MAQEPARLKYGYLSAEPGASHNDRQLDLKVIFSDLAKTAAALTAARTMARGLSAHITLMAAQVVPYPLPLTAPDVPVEFTQHLLESIAGDDTTIEIYLCRDRCESIRRALTPDSVVIIGMRKWRDWRLTRLLRQDGRRVLVVPA